MNWNSRWSKRLSAYRHSQLPAVREVHLRLTSRWMLLLEVHLTLRAVQRAPVPSSVAAMCADATCRNRPGCRPSSHSRTVRRTEHSPRCPHEAAALCLAPTLPPAGSGPRPSAFAYPSSSPTAVVPYSSSAPTSRSSLMPPPAACCVLPFISFCLINTTCRSVINLLTSCEGDNHLYQPANSSVVTGKSYCRVSGLS